MLRCSHVLCKVEDIAQAVRDYRALGFTVEWGSAPERAHNALVWFEHGPFIELFELPRRFRHLRWPLAVAYGRAAGERIAHWAQSHEGFCDLALEPNAPVQFGDPTQLSLVWDRVRARGVVASRVIRGKRRRPDGQVVCYRFFALRPVGTPFVVSAYDPPQRPKRVVHDNGARQIERIRVGVSAEARQPFDALASEDPRLSLEVSAAVSSILDVSLTGLDQVLDSTLTHGARLSCGSASGGAP